MAGNSKRKRKPAPKGIGTMARKVERMETGLVERRKRKAEVLARNQRLALLPMGHPANAYVLDLTFGPLYKMFDDHDATGSHMFMPDGRAVMWVERDQCYTPIVDACFELSQQFEFTAGELGWGDVPPGLMGYGAKLARGARINAEDQADARATVQWMRDRLSEINCITWAASMKKMEAQQAAQQQEAA